MTHSKVSTSNKTTAAAIMLLVLFCFSIIGCSQADRVNGLIQKLKDKDLTARQDAAYTLVEMGDQAIEPLIEALKNDVKLH